MNSFSIGTEKLYSLESPIKKRIKLSTVGMFLFGLLTITVLVISHRKVLLRHTETTTLPLPHNDAEIGQDVNLTTLYPTGNGTENHFPTTVSASDDLTVNDQDDYITTLSPQPNDIESEYLDISARYDFDVRPFWGGFCFHYCHSCNELKQRNNNSEICENASVELVPIPNINWGCMCPVKKY